MDKPCEIPVTSEEILLAKKDFKLVGWMMLWFFILLIPTVLFWNTPSSNILHLKHDYSLGINYAFIYSVITFIGLFVFVIKTVIKEIDKKNTLSIMKWLAIIITVSTPLFLIKLPSAPLIAFWGPNEGISQPNTTLFMWVLTIVIVIACIGSILLILELGIRGLIQGVCTAWIAPIDDRNNKMTERMDYDLDSEYF